MYRSLIVGAVVVIVATLLSSTFAQQGHRQRAWTANVVVPQCTTGGNPNIQFTGVHVGTVIRARVATTTMEIELHNSAKSGQLAEILLPVPPGAVVRSFAFDGASAEPTAELLAADQAKSAFESIVAKLRDPALLEFAGFNLVRSSVFPIPADGSQKIRLTYEHLLPAEGPRVDFVIPRSESLTNTTPWHISVTIQAGRKIAAVYSPSHPLETTPVGGTTISARIADHAVTDPGDFRLSYLLASDQATATLFTYPDPDQQGGYFLLLAGISPPQDDSNNSPRARELTLVLDRSGSMRGAKLQQAREAALQTIAGLNADERFNILAYNDVVDSFAPQPIEKNDASLAAAAKYLESLTATGGTNIHDALVAALAPASAEPMLPIVLFLTDGRPTVGQTGEAAIHQAATDANRSGRRVFTFGVGVDVNAPLLDRIALQSRAFATYVLPEEDVEAKVGKVFRGLAGPMLTRPQLVSIDSAGEAANRIDRLMPTDLPDLFAGNQLTVVGRYSGPEKLQLKLSGRQGSAEKAFQFSFDPKVSSGTQNAFVARFWASRRIGYLTDKIRDLGAEVNTLEKARHDIHLKELTDEIVTLSTKFGILTEYTSFLAEEGTDLTEKDAVLAKATYNFQNRAVDDRSGAGAVNQSLNNLQLRGFSCANPRNRWLNAKLNSFDQINVQQVGDNAFYRRGQCWVDARVVEIESPQPNREIAWGSPEFLEIVWNLASHGTQDQLALDGDILTRIDGELVLIKGPVADVPSEPVE